MFGLSMMTVVLAFVTALPSAAQSTKPPGIAPKPSTRSVLPPMSTGADGGSQLRPAERAAYFLKLKADRSIRPGHAYPETRLENRHQSRTIVCTVETTLRLAGDTGCLDT